MFLIYLEKGDSKLCFRSQRNWSNVLQFDILLIKIFCRLKVSYIVWYGNDVKDTQNIYDGVYHKAKLQWIYGDTSLQQFNNNRYGCKIKLCIYETNYCFILIITMVLITLEAFIQDKQRRHQCQNASLWLIVRQLSLKFFFDFYDKYSEKIKPGRKEGSMLRERSNNLRYGFREETQSIFEDERKS